MSLWTISAAGASTTTAAMSSFFFYIYIYKKKKKIYDAVRFLETYDGDKPFCLIVALVNPHDVQELPGPRHSRRVDRSDLRARRIPPLQTSGICRSACRRTSTTTSRRNRVCTRRSAGCWRSAPATSGRSSASWTYARFYAYLNQLADAHIGQGPRRARCEKASPTTR